MAAAVAVTAVAATVPVPGAAAAPKVVASIGPIHALVAGVMNGVGEPDVLVRGGASPHAYSLRPSEAAMLEAADAVFWVGPDLEVFLSRPLESLAPDARHVALIAAPGLTLYPVREGGAWEHHDHGDDDDHEARDDDHDDDHGDDHGVDHGEDHGEDHGDDHGDEHADDHADDHDHAAHGETDPHIWLDPANAKAMVGEIATVLSEIDPGNAATYGANAETLTAELDALDSAVDALLAPVRGEPYVVFHDAYHAFEARYGLNAVGSVTLSPEQPPSARRLDEIRDKIREVSAVCVFSEPQFRPALVETVTAGTAVRSGELDPLGADLDPGPEAYFTLIRNLANGLHACLSAAS